MTRRREYTSPVYHQIKERTRFQQREQAACAGDLHPDHWYSDDVKETRRAVEVCGTCPVRVACLEWALTNAEQWGVWGGMTEEQRGYFKGSRISDKTKIKTLVRM